MTVYYQAEVITENSNMGKNFSRKTAEFVCRLAAKDVLGKLFVVRDVQMSLARLLPTDRDL